MLKWAVIPRQDGANTNITKSPLYQSHKHRKRLLQERKDTPKAKRKRYNQTTRHSERIDNKLHQLNKENCTSTPIILSTCNAFNSNVLKDTSNLYKCPSLEQDSCSSSPVLKKRKCIDEYLDVRFVDCNASVESDGNLQKQKSKRRHTYAPTLPHFSESCSPCCSTPNLVCTRTSPLDIAQLEQNSRIIRTDHVNDFLHQISSLPMAHETQLLPVTSPVVSPLVKTLIDLKFSVCKVRKSKSQQYENSSLINDLSVDQIVDAVLDTPINKLADCNQRTFDKQFTKENTQKCGMQKNEVVTNSICSQIRSNQNSIKEYMFYDAPQVKVAIHSSSSYSEENTVLNSEQTYNERCVDDVRECKSIAMEGECSNKCELPKSLTSSDEANFRCSLRRQKCIRRKKSFAIKTFKQKENVSIINVNHEENEFCKQSTPHRSIQSNARRCLIYDSSAIENLSKSLCAINESITESTRGNIELNLYWQENELFVHVIRCGDLVRANGNLMNAYVKIILKCDSDRGSIRTKELLQRTSVQANTTKPFFNQVLRFTNEKWRLFKQIQIEVWHKDQETRTREFLGATSFNFHHVYQKNITGTFNLLALSNNQNMTTINEPKIETLPPPTIIETHPSTEDLTQLASEEAEPKEKDLMVLSEEQKSANDNLFLRFLELDPVEGPDALPAALQRRATGNKCGRTPFTHTKQLTKTSKSGYGFSVIWTHPPRIERVEKGLPADRDGILPGDYIIFVDKYNVVMMPEVDVLNLIRSCGNQLSLEIFRRNASTTSLASNIKEINGTTYSSTTLLAVDPYPQRRSSTECSTTANTTEYNKKKLHLPQITFTSESYSPNEELNQKHSIYQLINKEENYITWLQFGISRYVAPLIERKDIITAAEHKLLFQNFEELLRVSEVILDMVVQEDQIQLKQIIRIYLAKSNEMSSIYKRYCSGIKKADCVLANKTRDLNCDFVKFLQTPAIPRKKPDLTAFIHKPLEHYRDILRLLTNLQKHTKCGHEDFHITQQLIQRFQKTYREITSEAGLMEPAGEGRPLLTIQDLESRVVFTKCQPFALYRPGRQWIFGGNLSKIEGRNVKQYWALLFNDLLLFSKVSRDRVLFVVDDPVPISNISNMSFHIRKKDTEFRLIVSPNATTATSPTVKCGPDITRTPKKSLTKNISLKAPTVELKAVWQNLLQRQVNHVGTNTDGSSFSSPLESPDAPITSSIVTLPSAESLSLRRQQFHNVHDKCLHNEQSELYRRENVHNLNGENNCNGENSTHLENWIHSQSKIQDRMEIESHLDDWTKEMVQKRSKELRLINGESPKRFQNGSPRRQIDKVNQIRAQNRTADNQVDIDASYQIKEAVPICKQCHKTCLASVHLNSRSKSLCQKVNVAKCDYQWMPLQLVSQNVSDPTLQLDPFGTPFSQICISQNGHDVDDVIFSLDQQIHKNRNSSLELDINKSFDDSPLSEDHPYHSLNSSNITLKKYGTISSLERVGSESQIDKWDVDDASDEDKESNCDMNPSRNNNNNINTSKDNKSPIIAECNTAEKHLYISKLGEECRSYGRYLYSCMSTESKIETDIEGVEEEVSGATSGEEVWGTPTSGGDFNDVGSPNQEIVLEDGSTSDIDDTGIMMDELLMAPQMTGSYIRGLLPRTTLEPLIEEGSEVSSIDSSNTVLSDECSATGNAADIFLDAAQGHNEKSAQNGNPANQSKIHRTYSYQQIVNITEGTSEENIQLNFFQRFRPIAKYSTIKTVQRTSNLKLLDLFHIRRERRIHQIPKKTKIMNMFTQNKEQISSKTHLVPTKSSDTETEIPVGPVLKDKQHDNRFWKMLRKRRSRVLKLNS